MNKSNDILVVIGPEKSLEKLKVMRIMKEKY